jgi:hypothetical protein
VLSVLSVLDVLSGLSAVALAEADVLSWAYRRPRLYMGTGMPCPPELQLINHIERKDHKEKISPQKPL